MLIRVQDKRLNAHDSAASYKHGVGRAPNTVVPAQAEPTGQGPLRGTPCCASFVSFLQGFDELRGWLQVLLGFACHVVAGHLDQEPWPSIDQRVGLLLI